MSKKGTATPDNSLPRHDQDNDHEQDHHFTFSLEDDLETAFLSTPLDSLFPSPDNTPDSNWSELEVSFF